MWSCWVGEDCGLVRRSGAVDSGAGTAAVAAAAFEVAAGRALQVGAGDLLWMPLLEASKAAACEAAVGRLC